MKPRASTARHTHLKPRPPRSLSLLATSLLVGGLGCTGRVAERPLQVQELETPSEPGSGEPNLTVGADGRVLLSWIEPVGEQGNRLRYATRTKGGAWSAPQTIAEGTGWFVNWADFPSVATLPDGTMFAHWLARAGAGTYAYGVRVSASRDGGKSWSPPVIPHRDGTPTEHGFVTFTPWNKGAMGLVWLDGRQTAGSEHGGHENPQAQMSLVHTTVAADGSLGEEVVLDRRVCDCCQTDAVLSEGATVVVYRDRSESEVRDMSIVRHVDGVWSAPRPLARDGWQIKGCPVNGPAIAAEGASVAVAWFTAPSEKARVNVTFSSDSGATFGAPIQVDEGRPLGRVDVVLLRDGVALVSWLEQAEKGGALLRARRVAPGGARAHAVTVAGASAARSSGFPRMAASGEEVVVAWRDAADSPRVRTAVIHP